MSYLVVNGGKKLTGRIPNQSAKNAALYILASCLMIKEEVRLSDVPAIEEVDRMIKLLRSIGVVIKPEAPGGWRINAARLDIKSLNAESCDMRSSLFLFGALAARVKKYKLYKSGGCRLGKRTVRPHIFALSKFGVDIESQEDFYSVTNHPLRSARVVMYESGDTATGNAIMAGVLSPGTTVIKMASANYMVQDLCHFLNAAGAKISGIGTTTLTIEGVKSLRGVADYSIMPDPIVAMTYLAAGIVTNSALTVVGAPREFLELELTKLEVMGQQFELKNETLSKSGHFNLVDIKIIPSRLKALPDKIECRPFPGLNIDNLPLFIPILAVAEGRTLVHDWVYEDRAFYSLELKKLGVNVTLIDTHRVWVEGPTIFKPNEIICPPALRPAVNVLIAMLSAPGRSVLRNSSVIDRGYERIYETLNKAGADIAVVAEK